MAKKITFLFSLILLTAIVACTEKKSGKEKHESYIHGLASPVRLQFDSTRIMLTDYFPEGGIFDSIVYEGELLNADSTGMLLITRQPSARVSNLHVVCRGQSHDIPVFASEKVKHVFTYKASNNQVSTVELSGSMNGWNRKANPLYREGDVWKTEMILNNGLYQYRVWEDGKEMLDAGNPQTIDNGMGGLNNTFHAGPVQDAAPRIITASAVQGKIEIKALDPVKQVLAYYNNQMIPVKISDKLIEVKIPEEAASEKRSHIRVFADNGSVRSNDLLIPLNAGQAIMSTADLQRSDMQASIMYFTLVDRFRNGDTTNDRPTNDPEILPVANNYGGDLQGITESIRNGYFEKLGINTIWVSPISKNAEGAWGLWDKGVKSKFSAYHGYWPVALRQVDNRFGNEEAFRELIRTAHEHKMNVILDYVAHHVHQDHPLVKEKPEWTTPLYLPDGTMNTEKWDEHRLTTWFDTFLPTWKFADHAVVDALTDSAMYWVENFELDGFRHDATKHINEDFWRTLTRKVRAYQKAHPERKIYQVGETYGSAELISSYINTGELDAQFDFNLYDAAVDAFAKPQTNFKNLGRVMNESATYYGSHHLMGNITGNQDRARFISYADGSVAFSEDAKLAGWTRKIENKGLEGYRRLAMLNTLLMTSPGIPCIYYGDEIGLPGGNDPDNRRMMQFENLNAEQRLLRDRFEKLIALRKSNMALNYGDLFVLKNDDEGFVYVRSYFGQNVLVIFRKPEASGEGFTLQIDEELMVRNPQKFFGTGCSLENGVLTVPAEIETESGWAEIFFTE